MTRTTRFWLQAVSIILVILTCRSVPQAQTASTSAPRLALVIGNAAYRAGPLPTAANDAGLVGQTLAQAGFDVTAGANLDADGLRAITARFLDQARAAGPDAVLFVYIAGYGLQYAGENEIVPIEARIARDVDVPGQVVSLDAFVRQLADVPAKSHIVAADLSRASPFAARGTPLAPGLSLTVPPAGTLVAFNAAPGADAPVDASPYGAYARALAEMLRTPGLTPTSLFARLRLRVGELTNGAAVPWSAGTPGDVALLAGAPGQPVPAASVDTTSAAGAYAALILSDTLADQLSFLTMFPTDPLASRVRGMAALRREATTWSDAVKADNPRAVWTYMRRYPRGPHHADARRRLVALQAQLEPPPRFDIVAFDDVAPPPAGEIDLLAVASSGTVDSKWPAIPRAPAALLPAQPEVLGDAMAPPPLVPAGMLPIAMPILAGNASAGGVQGKITQFDVAGLGDVVTTASTTATASVMTSTAKGAVLSKTSESLEGNRVIVQTDPTGSVISRTEIVRDRAGTSIVQTGPGGGIVLKIATHAASGGGRSTVVTNGSNETLSMAMRDDQGIVTSVKRGSASVRALDPVFQPAQGQGQHPVLVRPVLPPPEPIEIPVETDALASPSPPPPLSLPQLPPPPTVAAKPAPAGGAPPPAAAAAKPDTPPASAPENPQSSDVSTGDPAPSPAVVPEPLRRPEAVAPKHADKPKQAKGRPAAHPPAAKAHAPRHHR